MMRFAALGKANTGMASFDIGTFIACNTRPIESEAFGSTPLERFLLDFNVTLHRVKAPSLQSSREFSDQTEMIFASYIRYPSELFEVWEVRRAR